MKISILANNDVGLYNFRKEIIESFIKKGYEVHIVLPYGEKVELLVELGCIYHEIKLERRGKNPLSDFKLYKQFKNSLKEISPAVVLTYTIKPNIYGTIAAKKLDIPVIMNITGLGTSFQNEGVLKSLLIAMYKKACKHASYIMFQNKQNMDIFYKSRIADKTKLKLINGSGVNLEEYSYQPFCDQHIEMKKFIFIGRIMEEKGIKEYLEVAKEIFFDPNMESNLEFHVYGAEEDNTIDIVKDYDAKGIINYHGVVSNTKSIIQDSFALVLPSYHEGMSNVLLENAAMGRIGIASNIPGCQEIILDKKSGFLFEKKNTEELYNAICTASKLDLNSANEFGKLARNKVESEFDRKKICEIYNQLIDEIVKG